MAGLVALGLHQRQRLLALALRNPLVDKALITRQPRLMGKHQGG